MACVHDPEDDHQVSEARITSSFSLAQSFSVTKAKTP